MVAEKMVFLGRGSPTDRLDPSAEAALRLALTPAPSSFIVHPPQIPFGYTSPGRDPHRRRDDRRRVRLYYGLQANDHIRRAGPGIVQLTFVLGLSLAWVASYVLRVIEDMTYVKQAEGLRGRGDGEAPGGAPGG